MTTKSEISTRQLGIMIFYAFCGLKFINLASLVYQKIEDVAFVVVLFLALVDVMVFLLILVFIKRHPGVSFYQYLSSKIGVICAKIVYFLIFFYYLMRFSSFISANYEFLRDAIFSTAGKHFYLSIIIPVVVALGFSSMKAFSRTCEFFFLIAISGFLLCVALGYFSGSFSLPYLSLDTTASEFFSVSLDFNYWFGNSLFLLLFMDKIKVEKNFLRSSIFFTIFSFVCVIIFVFCFYGVFGRTSFIHHYTIYDVAVFGPETLDVGRLDFIPVITMMFFIILQSGIMFRAVLISLEDFCGAKHERNVGSVVTCVLASLALIYFFFVNEDKTFSFFQGWFKWLSLILAFIFPILLLFDIRKRRRKNEK